MWKTAAALAAVAMLTAGAAEAQVKFQLGGGLTIPTGDLADEESGAAENGFNLMAGITVRPPMFPVGLRVDGSFNRLGISEEAIGDANWKYQVVSGTANAVFTIPTPGVVQPYFLAGVGLYNYKLTGDDVPDLEGLTDGQTDFGINGGVGVNVSLGTLALFGEARMHNVFASEEVADSDIRYIPITVGLRLGR